MNILRLGDKAPGFRLLSTELKETNLSDYEGQICLLLFFPFAFTGTCTKELCTMRDEFSRYSHLNVQIIGISVDSPYCLRKYKEELQLNFPLLSYFNKQTSRAYTSIYEEYYNGLKGVSKRSAFLIDKEGHLRYIEILENAGDLPNFESINSVLTNLN